MTYHRQPGRLRQANAPEPRRGTACGTCDPVASNNESSLYYVFCSSEPERIMPPGNPEYCMSRLRGLACKARRWAPVLAILPAVMAAWLGLRWWAAPKLPYRVAGAPPIELAAQGLPEGTFLQFQLRFRWGDTLETVLARLGLERDVTTRIAEAVNKVFDVRRFRAGSELAVEQILGGPVERIRYVVSPDEFVLVERTGENSYTAQLVQNPYELRAVAVCGTLTTSLFDSMLALGENPELALRMAEIFAWDLDFYTDPRAGDQFCLVVEKKLYLNGQPPSYGRILAARYDNAGRRYEGFLFEDEHGEPQYYSRDGRALKAAFLRSPLKFTARVSSPFSYARFHPILKIFRPHLGTDYAAPAGTPVQAIASGEVTFAGYSGGAGNMVSIRHPNGYETRYLHLSRVLVRAGQRVAQGQVIGHVGATGLATGPHLDFRILQHGRYLNFEQLRPPRASRIPDGRMGEFRARCAELSRLLDQPGESEELLARRPRASSESTD